MYGVLRGAYLKTYWLINQLASAPGEDLGNGSKIE